MIREQIRPVEVGFQIGALDSALSQSNRAGGDSGQLESEPEASILKQNFQADHRNNLDCRFRTLS